MYSEKECLDFFDNFKNCKNIKKEFSYDEYKVINELISSGHEESAIRKIFKDNENLILNSEMPQFYLMDSNATPINIVVRIIQDVMSVPVLLKAFNNQNIANAPDKDNIYKYISNSLFEGTIEEHIYKEISQNNDAYKNKKINNNTLFTEDAIQFLSTYLEKKFLPLNITRDNRFAEEMLNKYPDDEELRTTIANNVNLRDNIRNRAFDEGCVFEKITVPTQHMSDILYESAIETLSMVEKVDEPNFLVSKKVMENLIYGYALEEPKQLDIVLRYADDKKVGYSWLYSDLCEMTAEESVFEKIVDLVGNGDANSVYIRNIYKVPFVPDKFLSARAERIITDYKDSEFLGIEEQDVISKALVHECINKKELYEILLRKNHIPLIEDMAHCSQTPNDVLYNIIDKTISTNRSHIAVRAALNIAMNKVDSMGNKQKSLFFTEMMMSLNKLGFEEYHNILKEKTDNFNVYTFIHNINKDINRECILDYMKEAKTYLRGHKEIETFIDKIIERQKESFKKDDTYNKLGIEITAYGGENEETMFERKTLTNIFSVPQDELKEALGELSFNEISFLKDELTKCVMNTYNTYEFSVSENRCKLYEKADIYIPTFQTINNTLKEKEKMYEKEVDVDER